MQYQAHPDFLPALQRFYHRDGNYRKTANKVLAAWAKSQHQAIFTAQEVFQDFQLTNHGEDRIRYCLKYDLHKFSRLITQQHQDICTFLFIGTHSEADEWLNKNRSFLAGEYAQEAKQACINSTLTPTPYTRTHLQQLKTKIAVLKTEIVHYQPFFKNTDVASNNNDEQLRKNLVNQFQTGNTVDFKNQVHEISKATRGRNIAKAIKQAESLEMFTDLLKLKVEYIATLKEYLEVSKNLH